MDSRKVMADVGGEKQTNPGAEGGNLPVEECLPAPPTTCGEE